jgi:hypothetical protein
MIGQNGQRATPACVPLAITFQGTRTWKESTEPHFEAKLDRNEYGRKT